jgi:DNA-binding response OmpR family regulator
MNTDLKILAVDDDEGIRKLLKAIFEKADIDARIVGSLAEFRAAIEQKSPDICIIDIGLPDGDGLSLVSELRYNRGLGVVVLTGRATETDLVLGLELGADDYVVKPFRARELLARLNAVARRRETSSSENGASTDGGDQKVEILGYTFDVKARTVANPEHQHVDLTTAEFDVLSVLLEHRGKVVSRSDIVAEVKGASWNNSPRAVDGLVSRLRKKLSPRERDKQLIKTLHGKGYMLAPETS